MLGLGELLPKTNVQVLWTSTYAQEFNDFFLLNDNNFYHMPAGNPGSQRLLDGAAPTAQ
jgi:hypothetical protein